MSKPLMLSIDEVEALKGVIKAAMRDVLRELLEEKESDIARLLSKVITEAQHQGID
jgi:DNA-binding protein YbaB